MTTKSKDKSKHQIIGCLFIHVLIQTQPHTYGVTHDAKRQGPQLLMSDDAAHAPNPAGPHKKLPCTVGEHNQLGPPPMC